MRTSTSQFETIVEFMRRHGDLAKPGDGPAGRLRAIQLWAQLADRLNVDVTGDRKTVDKWKKVWSDFKLNTKRKAAKINQSVLRTGGGPPCRLYLSDLEQQTLDIIGPQSATGLVDVPEVGVEIPQPPPVPTSQPTCSTPEITPTFSLSDIQVILPASVSPRHMSRSPVRRPLSRSPLRRSESPLRRPESSLRRPRSPLHHISSLVRRPRTTSRSPLRRSGSPPRRPRSASLSPLQRRAAPQSATQRTATQRTATRQRTATQRTPPRRESSRRTNPRPTTTRSSQLDDASALFVAENQRWCSVLQEFAREQVRLRERELEQQAQQVRLRERELEQQALWHNLARDCVDLLRQFLNK